MSFTIQLQLNSICKRYNQRLVLQGISFEATNGEVVAITGNNGTGKTTLLKIIAGLSRPSGGTVTLIIKDKVISPEQIPHCVGFVAPYLEVYKEFSPAELLVITARMRGITWDGCHQDAILSAVGLQNRAHDNIRGFSSGMQQRVKYALALQHQPPVLLLDEPTTNLDQNGITMVHTIVRLFSERGGIVLIATNDERDILLCTKHIAVQHTERAS